MSVSVPVIDRLDLVEKEIYLRTGVREYHPVEDIYTEVRNLRRTDESLRVVDMPVKAFGNISKGGGKYTPRYAVFYDGWRIVPEDISHTLTITGEQITDDGQSGEACVFLGDMTPGNSVFIQYYPPAAEIVRDEVSLAAIAHMSFNNEVWVDHIDGFSIAAFTGDPNLLGNSQYPVDNHADALVIATAKKISQLRLSHSQILIGTEDFSGFRIRGDSAVTTQLDINIVAEVYNCEFNNLTISGVLDGNVTIRESVVNGLEYVNGIINNSALTAAPVVLGGSQTANLFQCYSGVPGGDSRPQIDFNHGTTPLAIRDWYGGLELVNKSQAAGEVSIDMSSGTLYIRSSCTAGNITVRGIGHLVDESGPGCTVKYDGLLDPEYVQRMTYDNKVAIDVVNGKAGTEYPIGTERTPANNLTDALSIAQAKGFKSLHVIGNLTLGSGEDVGGYTIIGNGASANLSQTQITFADGYSGYKATFRNCRVEGPQSGETFYYNCVIGNITNAHCFYYNCIMEGPVQLEDWGATSTHMVVYEACYSAKDFFILDYNGSPLDAAFVDWKGDLRIINVTEADTVINIFSDASHIEIDSSCTAGLIAVHGISTVVDNSGPSCSVNIEAHIEAEDIAMIRKHTTNKAVIAVDGLSVSVYDDDGITVLHTFSISEDNKIRIPV